MTDTTKTFNASRVTMTDTTKAFYASHPVGNERHRSLPDQDLQKSREAADTDFSVNGTGEELSTAAFTMEVQMKIKEWANAAESGCIDGQVQLGTCYYFGYGVQQDMLEAVKLFRKAAEQGDAEAQCRLGLCYDAGTGVPMDKTEATEWYRRAAEQGYADAMHLLGASYYHGWGVPKSEEEAEKWLRRATEQGLESAIVLLQRMGKIKDDVRED